MNLDWKFIGEDIPYVLRALPVTLELTLISLAFAILLGIVFGIIELKSIPVLKQIAVVWNTIIKGVPLMIQLLFCYYALPYILVYFNGFLGYTYDRQNPSYFSFAVVAFAFNYGAYLTDVVVTSYRAVPAGQLEAAYSVGMTKRTAMFRIVIPQAFVISLPNLANYFMWLLKATSLASIVNVFEMTSVAKASTADNFKILEGYIAAAVIYWVVCIIAERLIVMMDRKLNRYKRTLKAA